MKIKGRYRFITLLLTVTIITSLITRTVLLVKSLPNLELTPLLLAKIYAVGLYFDCVTFSYILIPIALLLIISPDKLYNSRFGRAAKLVFIFLYIFAMLFDGVAEYTFFDEFATRFNFIAIDYLIYTTEVVRNIRESYPVTLIVCSLLVIAIIPFILAKRYLDSSYPSTTNLKARAGVGGTMLILPLCAFFAVNLGQSEISANNYANELASNGLYDLFSAFRNNELDYNKFYLTRKTDEVMTRLQGVLHGTDNNGLGRQVHHDGKEKHYNVILVCEESLSADFLSDFGNSHGITPNLDKLAKESLFFTHLYASGTRTVRGLEAINLSIPPLPGTAIVKRPGNENLFSLGAVMKDHGYDNRFIYGGHGYFDNMNHFFANNGYGIVDRTNFTKDEVTFANAWGVCDEDLFDKTIQMGNISHAAGKPFFSFVMTTSNHRPYTYPSGKTDIPSKSGRDGAVKYSDYAIGQLIAKAKKQPWFKDTIFVIVADHCAGSARKIALPIKNYEIPLFVYAPGVIKAQRNDRMMGQIDIAPTLLGLLNISYSSRFFGRDILNDTDGPERAFIATYQKLGYIEGDRLLVLDPPKKVEFYSFDRTSGKTVETPADGNLLLNGLAYYQGSAYAYKNRLNRIIN
ncbi:MAG TPA: LTA synthase family protein [Geobacteraceae bacterium]|nr:LTA synthase family protein [Geobacteraceae bacterium]